MAADAQSRVYGDANPGLTYQLIGGTLLVNGDGLTGALQTAATAASGVSAATASAQNTLTAGGNYTLTYQTANLSVTARPITVAADAQSRTYGDANPGLTYQVTGGKPLVNGDVPQRDADDGGNDGSSGWSGAYGISQNTLTAWRQLHADLSGGESERDGSARSRWRRMRKSRNLSTHPIRR